MISSEKETILKKVQLLHQLFAKGEIPTLTEHEVHPHLPKDNRWNYLYFTFPPSLNFQRNSPAMWQSALKTFNDPLIKYLFLPEKVIEESQEKIQTDLCKYSLALQRNKHTAIWITLAHTFHTFYHDDPRVLLSENEFDVIRIKHTIQIEKRKDFPYLSGPKMTNYWLYILSQYTDVTLKNMHEISIIPDTHVLQSTMQLGLASKIVTPLEAELLWKELLQESNLTPVQMHPVLWNWSRNNFHPSV